MTAAWVGLLTGDVWMKNARHANAMAQRLWQGIAQVPGIRLLVPVQSNGVFVDLPPAVQSTLRAKGWRFYTFLGDTGCRLMCAWDTSPETVDRFTADLAAAALV
jgi:threonine aldolase